MVPSFPPPAAHCPAPMDIVFVAHFAGSPRHGMVYGHYYLAREWIRTGHRVTIVSASYAHTRHHQPETHGSITEEYLDGIRYLWVRTPPYSPAGRIGRVCNILWFVAETLLRALPIARADLVICSSHYPLAIHPARRLARRLKARLVFEVRDLWPLTLIELGGAGARNPLIRAMQWSEKYAYRHAEHVVSVLGNAREYVIGKGMAPAKFLFVPNGIALNEEANREPLPQSHRARLDDLRERGAFLIGYAGRIGLANALYSLIDAVAQCHDPRVCAVILGEGPHAHELEAQAARLGISERTIFLEPVPKAQVHDFLQRMDILYIGLQRKSLFRFGVSPTKLNDYMLAARPIVHAIDTQGDMVVESGAGLSCRAEDSANICSAILKLKAMSAEERASIGRRGLHWIVENRNYEILAARFLQGITGSAMAAAPDTQRARAAG